MRLAGYDFPFSFQKLEIVKVPLPPATRNQIIEYAERDLSQESWFVDYFDFVTDTGLRKRLGAEFWSARLIYKLLESIGAAGSLLRAQIKLQVLQYASMYEALLHYLLFHVYHNTAEVRALMESPHRAKVAVSRELRAKLVAQTRVRDSRACGNSGDGWKGRYYEDTF
jgi:hypothetical protein